MEIKVDNFTINLHRAEETSPEEEVKRLVRYVYTICELGKQQKLKDVLDKVAIATERKSKNEFIKR